MKNSSELEEFSDEPLEDDAGDIAGKAMRGIGLSSAELAQRLKASEKDIQKTISSGAPESLLAKIADALGLDASRLHAIATGKYTPKKISFPAGLHRIESLCGNMKVNCYLAFSDGAAALFDTGADPLKIFSFLEHNRLQLKEIFITHSHHDHICSLEEIIRKTGGRAHCPKGEPLPDTTPLAKGKSFFLGNLQIAPLSTPGHSPDGISYKIDGLPAPAAIVGDAIFAGSVGGIKSGYLAALDSIQKQILSLAEETILCPGHGPATTVGEQKIYNPFFPAPAGK